MEENGGICYLIEKEGLLPCVVSSYSRLQGYNKLIIMALQREAISFMQMINLI
jgi:hypothetical protein